MDLEICNQQFIVGGATSGLGKAVALQLLSEGAHVIALARSLEALEELASNFNGQVTIFPIDVTLPESVPALLAFLEGQTIHGVLINAGGPPAKTVMETTLQDWDAAYYQLLRWKIALAQGLLPSMQHNNYGRLLFVESAAVKQPIENLVLSNAMRLAVVGFVKSLSSEMVGYGITANVLAPGSHNTPAINRLYHKKSEQTGQPFEEVKKAAIHQMPTGALGEASDFAGIAGWLLSPASRFITGQTISIDGGTIKGVMG